MIFIDTNYFIRYLLDDISVQHKEAKTIFKKGSSGEYKLFTSTIVIFEIYWVFVSFYKKTKKEVIEILDMVLSLKFIEIKEREIFEKAFLLFQNSNLELEDCFNLIYAKTYKMESFATFDTKLTKMIKKLT